MRSIGRLEAIAFITGFCLMAYELAAARVLAPTVGSSMYVWTSVIGVIIAALSLGYYVGGVVADRRGRDYDVSWLLIIAAVLVALTVFMYPDTLSATADWRTVDVRVRAVVAALVLFAPASFILGAISPYLAKLNVRSLGSSGRSIASLSALNSIGGIMGTFVTGFVLFGYIGSRETIVLVVGLLLMASWLLESNHKRYERVIITVVVGLAGFVSIFGATPAGLVSIDTASAHYEVRDFIYDGVPARGLLTGPEGIQSAVGLDGSKELLFWYAQAIAQLTIVEQPSSVLVLGGGAFTLPEYLAATLPDSSVDVVEIDPKLEGISERYFGFTPQPNLNLIFEDARTYVNQTDKAYDVVIADVYGDGAIPFSLVTREYGQALARLTSPKGVVLANIIGGLSGPCREVLDAVNSANAQGFTHTTYAMRPGSDKRRSNIVVRYSRSDDAPLGMDPIMTAPAKAYTDNYAPLERLYYNCRMAIA